MISKIFVASMVLMMSIIAIQSAVSTRIDVDEGLIEDHSTEIMLPSAWGPPAEISLKIPGDDLLVPFFNYAGSSFALAWMNNSMDEMKLLLTSSATERTLLEEITIGERILDGSQGMDVLLRDANGAVYGVSLHTKWSDTRSLVASDIVITGVRGNLVFEDVTGDDIKDLVHLVPNGTRLELYEGPFPSKKGKAVLNLQNKMEHIVSGMDLSGDGISEIILWDNNGPQTSLQIYHGLTLAPLAYLSNNREIREISHGDVDGNDIDDLFIQESTGPPGGVIKVHFGETIHQGTDLSQNSWNLTGNGTYDITGNELIAIHDIDGDGMDDMILGDPAYGSDRGRSMMIYGGPFWNRSMSGRGIASDASFIGTSPGDRLGSGCYIVEDQDGDLLPDLFFNSDGEIQHVGGKRNTVPTVKNVPSFYGIDYGEKVPSAEFGSTVSIRCVAVDGDADQIDILKAEVFTIRERSGTNSWIYLTETGPSTEVFMGDIVLSRGSIPGRSLGVVQNDLVSVRIDGHDGEIIIVNGVVGLEDAPVFLEADHIEEGIEDNVLTLRYRAWDPERAVLKWSFIDLPDWLEILDAGDGITPGTRIIRGIPDDGDVGWNNFTINVDDGVKSTNIDVSLLIINLEPLVTPVSLELHATEGSYYSSTFSFTEEGGDVFPSLEMEGLTDDVWLTVHANGTVSGIPRNRNVGNWSVRLIVQDVHGGWGSYNWNISVENTDPIVYPPYQKYCTEHVPILLDFNCPDEGDGMTFYSLKYSSRSVDIDPYTGMISFIPTVFIEESGENEPYLTIRVEVLDLFGGLTLQYYQLLINNTAPVFYTDDLPSTLIAGEVYDFDMGSNEEGLGIGYWKHPFLFSTVIGDLDDGEFRENGKFSIRPWNHDVGDHQIELRVSDFSLRTTHIWNLTILENSSFMDPWLDLSILRREGDYLIFKLEIEKNGFDPLVVRISVNETGIGRPISYATDGDPDIGEYVVDISRFNRSITVKVVLDIQVGQDSYRMMYKNYRFEIPDEENGYGGTPVLLIVMMILMIIILISVLSLFFIERTSYLIQSEMFKGGEIREGDVLSPIQDLPGITFGELSKELTISRKDLLFTLGHLGSIGMVRPMEDGMKMRFWPMMGAFVDGPLVLNRDQKRIILAISGNGRGSVSEISSISGLSSQKVEKELSMLDLKGSISKRDTSENTVYFLNSRQRAKVKKII